MPGYQTKTVAATVAGRLYTLCVLADNQQFADADGAGERAGVSSATWPLFGQLWPAGCVLAEHMATQDVAGKRIIEIGCGMALASLVLHSLGADVTASDHHPLTADFLARNCALNDLPSLPYLDAHWDRPDGALGLFDVIIASDVLYERGHADSIAAFIERPAAPPAGVGSSAPGRGNAAAMMRLLRALDFVGDEQRVAMGINVEPPFRGRLLSFRRVASVAAL